MFNVKKKTNDYSKCLGLFMTPVLCIQCVEKTNIHNIHIESIAFKCLYCFISHISNEFKGPISHSIESKLDENNSRI